MPKDPQPRPEQDMTDEQIADVFRTLRLPTDAPQAPAVPQQVAPVIYYPITGNSLPLNPH